MTEIKVFLEHVLNVVSNLGFFAPFVFVMVYVTGTLFLVPTAILALASGALFGTPMGFAVALGSSIAGASGGFFSGRNLSRGWILKKIASHKKIKALDDAVTKEGWRLVLLLRLSAVLPFLVLNYSLGLSKISFKDYISASLIGMIPGTLLYVYLGSAAGKMVFEAHQTQKSPAALAFIIFGLAMTIGMGVYSALIIKKAVQD